jgi:hypothetical protein
MFLLFLLLNKLFQFCFTIKSVNNTTCKHYYEMMFIMFTGKFSVRTMSGRCTDVTAQELCLWWHNTEKWPQLQSSPKGRAGTWLKPYWELYFCLASILCGPAFSTLFVLSFFKNFYFIHMCIQWLGHFSPLPPVLYPSHFLPYPSYPSLPGKTIFLPLSLILLKREYQQ